MMYESKKVTYRPVRSVTALNTNQLLLLRLDNYIARCPGWQTANHVLNTMSTKGLVRMTVVDIYLNEVRA